MIFWIRRCARIVAFLVFFLVFFMGIDPANPFDAGTASMAFLRALLGGALFWFAGFVIGDIVLKGVVEDIEHDKLEELEGGIVQRIRETKEREPVNTKAVDTGREG